MKFALVTGTSRGIGAALAGALLERGWRVTGCARGGPPAELAGADGYAHLAVDLTDREAVRAAFDPGAPELVGLETAERAAIVHNAAVVATAPVHALDLDEACDAFTLNVAVPLWLTGWFLRATGPKADVRVVEVSSGAATSAYPGWPVYCASKAALRMAGEVLAVEAREVPALEGRRVAVLSYAPGVVATAMQRDIRAASPSLFPRHQRFVEMHEQGRLVPPEAPAGDLAERLDAERWEPYVEARYGG
jgi:NAD(P)-dependent dehydrogenase (short-subunit alcohol dehydrogenase family)